MPRSTTPMPALSLAAVPGRRRATLELAREIEDRGFAGIYCPSLGDGLALCLSLAHTTREIPFGTSIQPIYFRHVADYANTAAYLHEVSNGRFRFGIGVSHGPVHDRLGIEVGKPLSDIRDFVERLRAIDTAGPLPPIVLATLRDRMVGLAVEIADGAVWANGSLRAMAHSLALIPDAKRHDPSFFLGDMIPTCVSDDIAAAAAVHRRTLRRYVALPNYRNYWRAAGYQEEMDEIESALAAGDQDRIRHGMTDAWLSDCTLYGPATRVREGVEAWIDAGIRTPILVPSSARGNQIQAFEELFAAFA